MKRAVIIVICLGLLVLLLYAMRGPLELVRTMVRLRSQELQAPLTVPVRGVRPSALRDTWGAARSGGRKHEGIDIFAPCGRPVVSATEGVVFSVGTNRLGGQVVWVLGPRWSWHYYAHLSRYGEVGRGDYVQSGEVLGYVGNTGNAAGTPCHLHYGIYREGGAINPYPLLAAREGQRKK